MSVSGQARILAAHNAPPEERVALLRKWKIRQLQKSPEGQCISYPTENFHVRYGDADAIKIAWM